MKLATLFFTVFSLGFSPYLSGQALLSIDSTLAFGSTDERSPLSQELRLVNTSGSFVDVEKTVLFNTYRSKAFSVTDSQFGLAPSDTFSLHLQFLPQHNISHNQVVIFKTSSGLGHVAVNLSGQGQYSNSYYSSTQDLKEEALKTALKARLGQGYNSLSYAVARDNMYASIDNSGGQVECIYTGRTATFNTRAGANSNSFNTEHLFPQGYFNQNQPMRSDIHHLYPCDVSANSRRGNDPFGIVSGSGVWNQGGSKSSGSMFEPRDVSKGMVARAMMYFVLRYQDYSNHFAPQEALLRQWHQVFPPSAVDSARNQAIFALQNNRNPFVDYPQFADRIHNLTGSSSEPILPLAYYSDDSIALAQGLSGSAQFQFVVYNAGNVTLTFSQLALSDAGLSFAAGTGGDFSLVAGQFRYLKINFDPAQSYGGDLSFLQGSASGINAVSIPINSSGPDLSTASPTSPSLDLPYPNPVGDVLQLPKGQNYRRLELVNMAGQAWQFPLEEQLSVEHLPAGVYLLRATGENGAVHQFRIVKK